MNFGAEQPSPAPCGPNRPSPSPREASSSARWLWLEPLANSRLSPLLWLLAGAVLIAALRWLTFNEPVDRDDGFYLAFGHGMHQGKLLYRDLIDHKPPGIFAAFYLAEFLTGYGPTELFLVNVAVCIASLFAAYACCALLTGNRKAGLAAGALWLVVSGNIPLLANQPNAEAFMNAFTLIGLACLAAAFRKPRAWGGFVLAGLALGAASLFKQVSLAMAAPVLAGAVLVPYGNRTRILALAEAAVTTGAIALCWLATLALFKRLGTYPEFAQWVFDYGKEYAGNLGANLFASVPFPRHSWILLPPILAGAVASVAAVCDRRKPGELQPALTLLLLALGTYVAVALPGKSFPHYHQLWFVFASLGFGFAVDLAPRFGLPARFTSFAPWSLPLLLALLQLPDLALSPATVSVEKYGPQFREARIIGDFLNQTLSSDESFFNFGDDAELYFLTGRSPFLPFADCVRLISPTYGARDREALLGQLRHALPDVIVADLVTEKYLLHPKTREGREASALGQSPAYSRELLDFVEGTYRAQLPPLGRFVIMARKESPWEKRWANPAGRSLQQIMEDCVKAEQERN